MGKIDAIRLKFQRSGSRIWLSNMEGPLTATTPQVKALAQKYAKRHTHPYPPSGEGLPVIFSREIVGSLDELTSQLGSGIVLKPVSGTSPFAIAGKMVG